MDDTPTRSAGANRWDDRAWPTLVHTSMETARTTSALHEEELEREETDVHRVEPNDPTALAKADKADRLEGTLETVSTISSILPAAKK